MSRLRPGATIGILGGGQLGTMMIREGHRMGYRFAVLDPAPECPAAAIADHYVQAAYDDGKAVLELAELSDVVTLETEHIPSPVLRPVEDEKPLRPRAEIFHVIQDKFRQKSFLREHGFPVPEFVGVTNEEELQEAVERIGAPSILKGRTGGYDGKGQARLKTVDDAQAAWEAIGERPALLEAFVPFEREISVILARGVDGEVAYYPVAENEHRNGILHTTIAPARIPDEVAREARDLTRNIAEAFEHVGVMTVELFLMPDGSLLVNEIAPRVHNSGHYTLGTCRTSQFEQHLRAILGLKLGDTTQFKPAVMLNVLGDAWVNGEPEWDVVLDDPRADLHLYGKKQVRPGRKMGHVTVTRNSLGDALAAAERIHDALPRRA